MASGVSVMDACANVRSLPITARGLDRRLGSVSILRGFDLHVPAGQFLAILGRSGSGKSTFLRLLAGLDRPDGGRIMIGGDQEDAANAIRIMFQEPRLLPWAKVLANVEVGLGPAAEPDAALHARAALHEVGLAERAKDWPAVLSGGQKQRVALARALVSRPKVLALDEPLGALDALTRIEMQGLLEQTWQSGGFTAVLVTHDVAEAVSLADRVVVIENGAIGLDLKVELPRPRRRGSAQFAAIEERVLTRLLDSGRAAGSSGE